MVLALVLAVAAPAVVAQDTGAPSAGIDKNGVAKAGAGGTAAQASCAGVGGPLPFPLLAQVGQPDGPWIRACG